MTKIKFNHNKKKNYMFQDCMHTMPVCNRGVAEVWWLSKNELPLRESKTQKKNKKLKETASPVFR